MIQGASANVLDFGADPTGATNSTFAIQAAVDSGAFEVYIPDGEYIVTLLNINNPVRLFGSGTLKKTSVTGTSILNITSSNVEVNGLTFEGDSVDTLIPTTNSADNAIHVAGTSTPTQYKNIKIRNCTINGVAGFGILVDYASNVWIEGNNISYCGYSGVTLLSVVHGIIDSNRISNIDSSAGALNWYGISITRNPAQTTANSVRSTNCVITNNVVSNVTQWTGIDIHAAFKCVVDSNQVYYCKNGMYAQYDDSSATYKQPSENVIFSNNIVEGNPVAADSALGIATIGLAGMPNLNITIIGNQIINGGGLNSTNGALYVTETKNCTVANNISKNSWRSGFSITGACDNVVFDGNEINGVQPDGSGSSTYYGYFSDTSMTNIVLRNNRFYNNTGTSINTPTYGILYAAGTYPNIALDKNRILNISTTTYLYNGTNANRYQDFAWILEPTSAYDTGWTLTSGNTTETYNVTVRRDVRGTPATNTMVWSVNRQNATNPKVAVIPTAQTSLTQYQLTAYTVDNTTFGAATNIPVMFTVQGICFTD
jgi:parallel beta-helix repeat protein